MKLFTYMCIGSRVDGRGFDTILGYAGVNSEEEALGTALKIAKEKWPKTTHYQPSVHVLQVPHKDLQYITE